MTSRIDCRSAKSIVRRSMPVPNPPVGGMPKLSAFRKSSSSGWTFSSSPANAAFSYTKRARWSIGSFNSVNALPISMPPMKYSNRSTVVGSSAFFFASGLMSMG